MNLLEPKKKYIKINYNELVHQDLLIKWLCQQTDIISYQTEKELKAESYREKGYPDLLVHYEDKEMIIELERIRKSKDRFESKLDTYYRDLKNGKEINKYSNLSVSSIKKKENGKVKNYEFTWTQKEKIHLDNHTKETIKKCQYLNDKQTQMLLDNID